jgi:hypothetical protein
MEGVDIGIDPFLSSFLVLHVIQEIVEESGGVRRREEGGGERREERGEGRGERRGRRREEKG